MEQGQEQELVYSEPSHNGQNKKSEFNKHCREIVDVSDRGGDQAHDAQRCSPGETIRRWVLEIIT